MQVPRSAWLAAGAAIAAGWVWAEQPAVAALVAGLLVLAAGLATRPAGIQGAVPLLAGGIGATLLALRVLAGPTAPPVAPLPEGSGPWTAVVESVGSPREGDQVARLLLRAAPGPVTSSDPGAVRVAATLPAFPTVRAGDTVEVSGRLRPPPDDDGYGEYLRRTGAAGSLDGRSVAVLAPPAGLSLQPLRDAAGDTLRLALPEPEAGLAAGILIGLRERVDRSLAADFATAGASHVVAISGWNIAIVAGLVGAMMRGRPRRVVAIVVGGTILAYVLAAGASPSVVRAAVMAGVVLLARESGRAGRAPAALALAAFAMLVAEPAMIGDAGFRLSVAATAGLLAWGTPLGRWIGGLAGGRMPGWLAEGLGISLAAQAATLPDVLMTFGRLSLVAPVVNLAVVPLVPAAMGAGVLAMAGGALAMLGLPGFAATLLGLPAWLLLHVIVTVVRLSAGLPFAAVAIPPEAGPVTALVAAVLVLAAPSILRRVRARRTRRPAKGSSAVSAGGTPASPGLPDPHLTRCARPGDRGRDRRRALDHRPRRHRRPRDPPRDARRGPGGRDPRREPRRRPDAGGRRTGPGAAAHGARCESPAVGSSDRPRRADASARGSRRRPRPGPGALPGGPGLRARDARPGTGLGGLGRSPAATVLRGPRWRSAPACGWTR